MPEESYFDRYNIQVTMDEAERRGLEAIRRRQRRRHNFWVVLITMLLVASVSYGTYLASQAPSCGSPTCLTTGRFDNGPGNQ